MSKNLNEIAKMASEWWADAVINPKFDNGDKSEVGSFGEMLMSLNTKPVSSESKEKFITLLTEVIEEKLLRTINNRMSSMILSVDYGPCLELRQVAEQAGVSFSNFPIKTTMWIGQNHISVSYGYRAKIEFLYANKDYWQNQIEGEEEAIEEYRNGSMLSWIEDEEKRKRTAKERISDGEKRIKEYQLNKENAED